jgi:hypothetical protein
MIEKPQKRETKAEKRANGVKANVKDTSKMGRPLAFKSPKELQDKIEEYFAYCDNRMVEVMNKETGETFMLNKPAPYTMGGLAVALDVDRRTIVNYSNEHDYFLIINKARARIEQQLEERMAEKETFSPGQIFISKNGFGWKDKNETDLNHSGEVGVTMQITNFSTNEQD